jgi:hypothetical protein
VLGWARSAARGDAGKNTRDVAREQDVSKKWRTVKSKVMELRLSK